MWGNRLTDFPAGGFFYSTVICRKECGMKILGRCVTVAICGTIFLLTGIAFPAQVEISMPTPAAKSPSADLVPLAGSVRKIGSEAMGMESGWAYILKPGDSVEIRVAPAKKSPAEAKVNIPQGLDAPKVYLVKRGHTLRWEVSGGAVEKFLPDGVFWKAPLTPGTHKLSALLMDEAVFSRIKPDEKKLSERSILGTFVVNFLVMYPFDREGAGVIEGYPIGIYPNEDAKDVKEIIVRHRRTYHPPQYFIKVTPENASVHISRHFTLGDFSTPGEKDRVRFIVLNFKLVQRLEDIITALDEKNITVSGLKILRGYLSPNEVERLRRKGIYITKFSRSIYGDSATFIVDENGDGIMDDLNGDGKVDIADLSIIVSIIEALENKTRLFGGVGLYVHSKDSYYAESYPTNGAIRTDTPCVQVDVRGWRSRWGTEPVAIEQK